MKRAAAAIFLLVTVSAYADGAKDMQDALCRPYATGLIENQMKWLWDRAYQHCQNSEDLNPIPPPTGDWESAMKILDPLATPIVVPPDPSTIGNTPATGKPEPIKPITVKTTTIKPTLQQPACIKARMKTIYFGKSWRCTR